MDNIFENIPDELNDELFEPFVQNENIKIERIISKGHSSPKEGWLEQDKNEWVIVLKGDAKVLLENKEPLNLIAGSYIVIPAFTKHKVVWTNPDIETVWLAVHY